MYPEIFHLPFFHTYGLLVAVAFMTALWLTGRLARRAGLNFDAAINLGVYCGLAARVGAKVMPNIPARSSRFPRCAPAGSSMAA
jgi:phosphatidylglycerol:prolipoprotein diacylglycerol transferase